jgi:two-component system, cell cycle sensor histidine kinase and response regulator CckA
MGKMSDIATPTELAPAPGAARQAPRRGKRSAKPRRLAAAMAWLTVFGGGGGAAVIAAFVFQPAIGRAYSGALALCGLAVIAFAVAQFAVRPLRRALGRSANLDLISAIPSSSPEAQVACGPDGEVLFANAAYLAIAGDKAVAPRQLLGGDAEAMERLRRMAAEALRGRPVSDVFCLSALPGGRARWSNLTLYPLPEHAGCLVYDLADVSDWHDMLSTMRAERDRLADFLDTAPVGFCTIDHDGRFGFVNATLAGWLGHKPGDLIKERRIADVVSDKAMAAGLLPQAAGGAPVEREISLKARDGAVRPALASLSVAVDDNDGRPRTRAVIRDMTRELAWRDALRQAEANFKRYFDMAPIGIVVVDNAGKVLDSNPAFRRLIGGSDIGQRSFIDLVREDNRADVRKRLAAASRADSGPTAIEAHLTEGERVVELVALRLDDGERGAGRLQIHVIDTTEQKKLELQFAQSQKMQAVGQLAGGIAHDFNNLLTAMIGFCDLLLMRYQPGDQSFADIMQVKQNANRAASLVRQLLAFSRQQTLRPKVLDLTDLLAELRHLLSRLLGETVELKLVHGRDLGLVKVDHGQLEQVIINLAVNARDAMPDGGTLTIRTANVSAEDSKRLGHELMPPNDYVLIEVTDTGKGIPKENLGKIFEPFFTTKEVGAGTGLGLSTVYGIVKQTGGFIFPESEVGKGAIFRIYLPRHHAGAGEAVELPQEVKAPARDLTGQGTVLLVEDEDPVRMFAARALRNKGYRVLEARSGDVALKMAQDAAETIDLLVSDVVMPNMDGPTLAKAVRALRPDVKIIFISGYAEDAFRKNSQIPADINFLPKPFSLSQLAGKVKEVISAGR